MSGSGCPCGHAFVHHVSPTHAHTRVPFRTPLRSGVSVSIVASGWVGVSTLSHLACRGRALGHPCPQCVCVWLLSLDDQGLLTRGIPGSRILYAHRCVRSLTPAPLMHLFPPPPLSVTPSRLLSPPPLQIAIPNVSHRPLCFSPPSSCVMRLWCATVCCIQRGGVDGSVSGAGQWTRQPHDLHGGRGP